MAIQCTSCGGYGLPEGCPKCGKVEGSGLDNFDLEIIQKTYADIIPYIPIRYEKIEFSKDELLSSHYDLKNSVYFNRYVDFLYKSYNDLKKGILPVQSAFVYAPIGFGKAVWAYSMIRIAISLRYSAVPLFDTTEIAAMFDNQINKKNEFMFKNKSYNIDDLVNSDICIVKIDANKNTPNVICSLMDKRSRRGLSTIFISRVSSKYISTFDDYGQFSRLLITNDIQSEKYLMDICFNKSDK